MFIKKRILLSRIDSVQRKLEVCLSNRLAQLEGDLKKELEIVLQQEEILWAQKTRCNWLQWSNHNIAFFHLQVMKLRKKTLLNTCKIAQVAG